MQPAGRDVDRGLRHLQPGRRPVVEVPQGLLEDHAVDGGDDVQLLGDLHEVGRRQQALGRVVPARQRLDADDGERRGVELRLVVGDELVALQARQYVVGDALGGDDLGLQRIVEELVAVAAAALGPVERDVGVDQQPARIGDRIEVAGDADRDAEAAFVALVKHRLMHLLDDAVGEAGKQLIPARSSGCSTLHRHDEFVAADARDEIAVRAGSISAPCAACISMASPAAWPSVSLICLKRSRSICRRPGALALGVEPLDMRRQYLVEIAAIGQAGQRIVQRVELDALLGGFQLRIARLGQRVGPLQASR